MAGVRRNLIGSIYLTAANVGGPLLLVPVFLHFWDTHTYGLWLVLFTIPAFFVFSDAGLANTVGNAVTLALEQGRPSLAKASLNAAWKFQAIAWAVIFGLLVLALAFFPIRTWLGINEMPTAEFATATLLLCLYSLVSLQTGIIAAIYRAARCYTKYLSLNAHARVLETVLVMAALAAGGRMITVATAMLTARVLGSFLIYKHGRSLLREVRLAFFSGRWRDLAPLMPSGLAFLSFPVANALINQGTVMIVNNLLGAPAVVLLSVCRQLARVFQQGTGIILMAFQPEITSAYGAANSKRIRELQLAVLVLPLLVMVPFVAGTTLLGSSVIEWWTRKDLGVTWSLLLACGLEAVAFGSGALCSLIPWSTNCVRGLSIVYLTTNLVALVLSAVLLPQAGIVVVPTAFCFAGFVYCYSGLRLGCIMGGFTFKSLLAPREIAAITVRCVTRAT